MSKVGIGAGLTLVTGATGSGKTALVVRYLQGLTERPIFVSGIPELKVAHEVCPPVDEWVEMRESPEDPSLKMPYFRFPAGAVVVLDEAQRVFRPRPVGSKVPPVVAAFETRRHTGIDVVLITQHPMLLDSNVRKLITRHLHIHCTFYGRYLLEWVGVGSPEEPGSRDLAVREKYRLPVKAFSAYKSSELHTKPVVNRPWWIYGLPVLVAALLYGGWYGYGRLQQRGKPVDVVAKPEKAGQVRWGVGGKAVGVKAYVAERTPRVPGLAYTAPVYDSITQPVEAPYPVGCIGSGSKCRCYDQRGGRAEVTPELCWQLIERPLFADWLPDRATGAEGASEPEPANRQVARDSGGAADAARAGPSVGLVASRMP